MHEKFIRELTKQGINFFTGVPDSYLNGFCSYLTKNISKQNHVIAANEGNAVAIAAGHYFATGTPSLVYMQNSGLGNAINPLVSLVDQNVYSVPMILVIGWRGEPGTNDWAQHKRQGEITIELLNQMHISYEILRENTDITVSVEKAVSTIKEKKTVYAFVVPKGIFSEKKKKIDDISYPMSREEAIETILLNMPEDTIYAATTGRATRELYFLREKYGHAHDHDYLNVGAMGHASSVALGLALANKNRQIVCLDGDAAAIMHMGSFAIQGRMEASNLIHIVLNNGAHESVGGEPSAGFAIDFTGIAKSCGYCTWNAPVTDRQELCEALKQLRTRDCPAFIDVRIHQGISDTLTSLKVSHSDLIQEFMKEMGN
ncbi:MAG: phosphonopyruvate decarboxylase [Lachnospiraceae bacterium]|nr:phosphonopyruvate decarboxylase [Lachnospiraceae bacterium]